MCFKCFGSVFPEHLFGKSVDSGTAFDFWAGISLAFGVLGDEMHFLNDADTQGAVLDKAGEGVLSPTNFTKASEDAASCGGACGFFVTPLEDLSLRREDAAGELSTFERTDTEPGLPAFREAAGGGTPAGRACFSLPRGALTGVPGLDFSF